MSTPHPPRTLHRTAAPRGRRACGPPAGRGPSPLAALGAVALAVLAWQIIDILLMVFAGLLLAVLLRTLVRAAARAVPLPERWLYPSVLALLATGACLAAALLAPRLAAEVAEVRAGFPAAVRALEDRLAAYGWGERLIGELPSLSTLDLLGSGVLGRLSEAFSVTVGALANLVFVLFVGVFVAADPTGYRDGALRLVPPARRARARAVADAVVATLRRWLLGQLFSMVSVGLLIGTGLALLGMPFALVVGVLAGVLEFVPFVGALVGGVVAVTLAFAEGAREASYVLVFYLIVQQIEGNVLMPLVQRYSVELAPALSLVAVLVVGALLGLPGLVVATPLVVVAVTLVRTLYIEDVLGDRAPPDTAGDGDAAS